MNSRFRMLFAVSALGAAAACSSGVQTDVEHNTGTSTSAALTAVSHGTAIKYPGSATSASGSNATYHGGAVLPHIRVIPVFWGSSINSTVTSNIGGFFSAVTDSNYLDWLDEYYASSASIDPIGRGSAGSAVTITPNNTNTSLTDTDIGNELGTQIRGGNLPMPDSNTMYMVYFPSGTSITTPSTVCGVSCVDFCACHQNTTQTINSQNVTFTFGMIPDFTQAGCSIGCGGGTMFENVCAASSHEMVETITDPFDGTGWMPEIGDGCNQVSGTITSSSGSTYTVQKEWSNAAGACELFVPECQRVSDAFGVDANATWGFAPSEMQTWWTSNGCATTHNTSDDTCQKASEIYGIVANSTWGYAPSSVQAWWTGNACNTQPLVSESACQRASDTFGIVANVTWGSAPSYVQTWWTSNGCDTVPHGLSACQKAADLYGIVAYSTWGFAPPDVQQWWTANGCLALSTTSSTQLCQNASNLYAIVANSSWGGAPSSVQTWWTSNSCDAAPQCQGVSEIYGTFANVTWGYAPTFVQSWWTGASCNTAPLFSADTCQRAADTFGIIANVTWGFAPPDVQQWWTSNGCNAHPRSSAIKQFTAGP